VTRRLLVSYLGLTIVVLAALEIPLAVTYRDRQLDQLEAGLQEDAFVMAAYVEDTLNATAAGDAVVDLDAQVAGYETLTEGRAVIVDRQGEVLADSDPAREGPRSFASRPEIAVALAGDVASGVRDSATLRTGLVYVAVPVTSGGDTYGAVRLSYSTDQLDERVHRYWTLLAAAAAVTLAIAGGIGVLLARWVTRPLVGLRAAAVRIGEGELDTRADARHGPSEVRDLAAAFNATAGRLEQLVTAQEQFVADASHQLRTPLTALRLRLEVMEDTSEGEAAEDLAAAHAEVQRLSRLVDGLLALARAERTTRPVLDAVPLHAVLADRRAAWAPVADERDVELVADGTGLLARVDLDHLGQVLDNLVANALDAAPPGTEVRLWARPGPAGWIEVHVTDEGPGMEPEQRRHAFDRFWRAHATRGELGGSGLGLAIVQKLVEADGGRIELRESEAGGVDAVVLLHNRDHPS
jgi:signal transduction histidine kinase